MSPFAGSNHAINDKKHVGILDRGRGKERRRWRRRRKGEGEKWGLGERMDEEDGGEEEEQVD